MVKSTTRNDDDVALNLSTTEAGDRYKDRANITVRIPGQWPAHSLLLAFLKAAGRFERRGNVT
jgi:hypothetical protein